MERDEYVFALLRYCDAPGAEMTKRVRIRASQSLYEWAEDYIACHPTPSHVDRAYRILRGERSAQDMQTETAECLLAAFRLADGVEHDPVLAPLHILAALICMLPIRARALLYYDCCARLGFDPAEA
jgi:hypothetical protein